MNHKINLLGRWSSALSLFTFVVFTISFIAISVINPPFTWSNTADFIHYTQTHSQTFKYIAMGAMMIFSFSFIVQLECLREKAEGAKRFYAIIAVHFAIAFSVLVSINYFVQISAVRLQIAAGQTEGISQLVQSNPISGIAAVNMLGWTVFLGLASLFASMAMGREYPQQIIRYAFLANGAMMLVSGAAYILNITIVLLFFMNFGLGAAIATESIAMYIYFKK